MMSPISRMPHHWQEAGGGALKRKGESALKLKHDYCYWDAEQLSFSPQRGAGG